MKRALLFLTLFIGTCLVSYSQNLTLPKTPDLKKTGETVRKTAVPTANMGNLVGELTNNLSDNTLTDEFKKQKPGFTNETVKTTDPAGLGNSLATLSNGIKPGSMDAGWNAVKGKFFKDAKSAGSIKTVAGLAGQLESHIKPDSFKGTWGKARPVWQNALKTLSK